MSTLHTDLIRLVREVASVIELPAVNSVILPHSNSPSASKYAKFGLLTLEDNSAGFFYRLLDLDQWATHESSGHIDQLSKELIGENPAAIAELIGESDLLSRGIGMAAINAISHHVFRRAGLQMSNADVGGAMIRQATHVGMVGYFGPTVAKLRDQNVKLTVLELDDTLYQTSDLFVVTGDVRQLAECDHIICTASTLLNDTLDELLDAVGPEPYFELVGPTCGCFPDPLFARGIDRIGGSSVLNATDAMARIRTLDPWGDSVTKYALTTTNYSGISSLLEAIKHSTT